MLFAELADYFYKIERENLRNKKTEILAEILKKAESHEVDKLVYLAIGGLRPEFDRLEFNLAEKMMLRAIGVSLEEYKKVGDLGEVAQRISESVHQRISTSATISDVYEQLERIALESGTGSQERKVARLSKLIREVGGLSAKYIVRMVAGKLRLGFSDKTVIDALSYFENGTKDYSEMLSSAYQRCPDVGVLARQVKAVGAVEAVKAVKITLGTPIIPALAQRLKTADEMIEKMGRVYAEKKWDGSRVQIHYSARQQFSTSDSQHVQRDQQEGLFEEEKPKIWVKSFTRNLDESSAQFPELLRIGEQIKATEVILDSEAVGYDPKTGKNVPFQVTITRKRKHGVTEASSSVPLKFYVFDIMYLNGESLIHLPLRERKKILNETVGAGEVLVVGDYIETESPDELREYHRKQLDEGFEGAVIKQVEGEYMPGRTGFNWVKFKEAEDSRAKLADTIDAVIMGYNSGKGKRSDFGIGAFLIGIRGNNQTSIINNQTNPNDQNNNEEKILTIAKVGTGISDELFHKLYERLKKIEVKNKPEEYRVEKNLEPDVWVEPKIVVEVAADEITISPSHTAGCALRFPRLVRIREDKGVEQITTPEEMKSI